MKNGAIHSATDKAEKTKKYRLPMALTAAAAAVLALFIAAAAVLSNSRFIYTAAANLIPLSYTDTDSGITFYRENAQAGTGSTDSEEALMSAYSYYYIDASGEKVYLSDGVYRHTASSGEQIHVAVSMSFVLLAVKKIKKIVTLFKIIIAALVVCIAAGSIKTASALIKDKKAKKMK